MKLNEVLEEGIEFHAATIEDHPKHGKMISPHNMRQEDVECWLCDGSGRDKHAPKYECGMCHGSGKIQEQVSDGPLLQVSNDNAHAIITDILGQEFDYGGVVEEKDLPLLRRKLMKMKNMEGERSSVRSDPSDEQKGMQRTGGSGNVTSIGRGGPRMIGPGRSDQRVLQYVDRLLKMVEYAMQHNLIVSWS